MACFVLFSAQNYAHASCITILIGEWARFLGERTKVALLLAADGFEEEGAALVLGDAVAGETGGSREAVVEIADEEIVDIGDV